MVSRTGNPAGRRPSRDLGLDRLPAKDLLAWFAVADGAWIISLNEVCLSSFHELANRFNTDGTFSYDASDHCYTKGHWIP